MELLNLIRNCEKLVWLARTSMFEIVIIMAAIAAHDNRTDFEMEEMPAEAVPETVAIEE